MRVPFSHQHYVICAFLLIAILTGVRWCIIVVLIYIFLTINKVEHVMWCWPSVFPLQTIHAGENVEKREPSSAAGENVNWFSYYGKQYGHFFKKLEIKLPHDPAIPLPGICPEKTTNEIDTCTLVFTEALFTIARTWKQPRCSLTRWIDKEVVIHIYNEILLSHKKQQIWVSSSEVDESRACYTEWSKSERENQILYINAYI